VLGGSRDNLGTPFGRSFTYNLGGQETSQNSAWFLTTFEFDREYPLNGSTWQKSEKEVINYKSYEYDVGRKKVELWSINNLPKWIFPRYYISALTVCWLVPQIFTRARDSPSPPSAHHKRGRKCPTNFNGEHLKFGLKFSTCASKTLPLVEV